MQKLLWHRNCWAQLQKILGHDENFRRAQNSTGHPKFHGCKNYSVYQKFPGIAVWFRKFPGIGSKILWAQKFLEISGLSTAQAKNPVSDKLLWLRNFWILIRYQKISGHSEKFGENFRAISGIQNSMVQKLFRVLLEISGHRPKNPLGEKFFCSLFEIFRALASVAQKIPGHRPKILWAHKLFCPGHKPKILRVQNYSVAYQKFPGILQQKFPGHR